MTEAANPVAHMLADWLFIPLLAVLLLNMLQRRHLGQAPVKRMATLILAGLVLVLLCAALVMVRFGLPDALLIPVTASLVLAAVRLRGTVFPFRCRCRQCGRPYSLKQILFQDDPRCPECHPQGDLGNRQQPGPES
jgi:hypothetical protein